MRMRPTEVQAAVKVITLLVVAACGFSPGDIGEGPPTGTLVAPPPPMPIPSVAVDCPECILIETNAVAHALGPTTSSTPHTDDRAARSCPEK